MREPVAQLVEHVTFNHGVSGSNPDGLTNLLHDLAKLYGDISLTGAANRAQTALLLLTCGIVSGDDGSWGERLGFT